MHPTQSKEPAEIGGKQGEEVRGAMELYHQYFSDGGYSKKEKRPPLKRGQLKRQIVRTISELVVPSGGGGGANQAAADRKFRREPSNN